MKRSFRCLIVVLILCSLFCTSAYAASEDQKNPNRSNAYINSFSAQIYDNGDGTITVDFSTVGTAIMDYIGVSVIRVYRSDGTRVAVLNGFARTDMLRTNAYNFANEVVIEVEPGYSYYAYVIHYGAVNGGNGSEGQYTRTIYVG